MDDLNPKAPAGHADGIRTSTWLTQSVKHTHRKHAMNISPQDVIDVLVAADVKNWVLMGLHGYVGYLPEPRATQDVDVMVPFGQRKRAAKAIREAWPGLVELELSQAVRFMDPDDLHPNGQPKPVIDLMLPWGEFPGDNPERLRCHRRRDAAPHPATGGCVGFEVCGVGVGVFLVQRGFARLEAYATKKVA